MIATVVDMRSAGEVRVFAETVLVRAGAWFVVEVLKPIAGLDPASAIEVVAVAVAVLAAVAEVEEDVAIAVAAAVESVVVEVVVAVEVAAVDAASEG